MPLLLITISPHYAAITPIAELPPLRHAIFRHAMRHADAITDATIAIIYATPH